MFTGRAWAEDDQATIAAFDALLSLPQTQPPDGGWQHIAPSGFDAQEGNEEVALIAWLRKQKSAGADLNALRHGGTMLHHAIRAGMTNTVSWLLANGADPLKEGEHDALELSVPLLQKDIFHLLLRRRGVLDARRHGIYMTWQRVLNEGLEGEIDTLAKAHVPLPSGKNRQRLLEEALRLGNVRLIRALSEPAAGRVDLTQVHSLDDDIEAADQHLARPVFLSLVGYADTDEDVDRLFRLHIRRPFDDAAFAAEVVRNTLWHSLFRPHAAPEAGNIFRRLPRSALQTAFRDENVLSMWWRWLSTLPAGERSVAMTLWGELPLREPEMLLKATIKGASWFDNKDPNAAAAWGELLSSLRPPLPEGVQGKLWMFVPQAHRTTLLRLGYRPSSEELRWWIDRTESAAAQAYWPTLIALRPEIAQRSHELLFRPVGDGSDYYCFDHWTIEKALPFTAAASAPAHPYKIDAACWFAESEAVRQKLLAKGWVKPPPPVAVGRFVPGKQQCVFRPSAAWRRTLAGLRSLTTDEGESVSIDAALPVVVPGERDCALLAWGGDAGGRRSIDDDSFEGMQRLTPCADGHYVVMLWRSKGESIDSAVQKDLPFPGGMTLIRDTSDGNQYWLGGGEGMGGCGTTPLVLFRVESLDGQRSAVRALPGTHPAMQALLTQCQSKDLMVCLGTELPTDVGSQRRYPVETSGIGYVADEYWNVERKAYVDAILAFRTDELNAAKAEGVFPHWVTDAISAVSASSLPIAEKRRRTAWLFRDRPLLRAALEPEMLQGLVDWLPREDWGPIIAEGPGYLEMLQNAAEQQRKPALACRFATALKRPCSHKEE